MSLSYCLTASWWTPNLADWRSQELGSMGQLNYDDQITVGKVRTAFERPLLNGVAYAQRVVNSGRDEFEKQHGWTTKTMKREPL
ncbi:hypothetical protein AgCh_014848 [Apium graveolens]